LPEIACNWAAHGVTLLMEARSSEASARRNETNVMAKRGASIMAIQYTHGSPAGKHHILKDGDDCTVDKVNKKITLKIYDLNGVGADKTYPYQDNVSPKTFSGTDGVSGTFTLSGSNNIDNGTIRRTHSGTHPFSHGTHPFPPVDVDDTGTFSGTHSPQ
jgi:hypothetical protein